MGKKRNKPAVAPQEVVDPAVANNVDAPVEDTTTVTDEPTATEDTPETPEVPEVTEDEEVEDDEATEEDEAEAESEEEANDEPTATEEDFGDPVFWVEGYGNVRAKSQAAAEKLAKKIIADQRK
jgi:hypothetical protein